MRTVVPRSGAGSARSSAAKFWLLPPREAALAGIVTNTGSSRLDGDGAAVSAGNVLTGVWKMKARLFVLWIAILAFVGCASAQSFPTRTVTLVSPFPPGGSTDAI